MADSAEHRAEEGTFLEDMPGALGPAAMQGLERIRDRLGLDYGGIDFALAPDSRLVVFEANATMVILPPDEGERWAYRAAPVERARRAVERMLRGRAAPGAGA